MRDLSEQTLCFYTAVYLAVQQVPLGRVTTYGHIGFLIGAPQNPRQVGTALKVLSHNTANEFNNINVPWWRVISAQGKISPRLTGGGEEDHQMIKLMEDGVEVSVGINRRIDLEKYGWFPEELVD
ncbi:hypothetical protein NADFUDRAFT_19505 [Nadsonia fulvescens var. elongata DSM 6958]|uniref:6-O-methylguanine-DNA methyltransferase n=1 Tax=Nadsonia fulvescens var. elongata DSM 6958 TaxID=857566 RepID=A0A1E3PRN8_9ASCO|nr:hypothetical protein NADFUDRAFT_19505 [Nadsonia fulvescens var. elongata DSM 6958]